MNCACAKKIAFQYCILAVANITCSCFGSSSRVSTNCIAANYVLVNLSRTTLDFYARRLGSNHLCFKDIWYLMKILSNVASVVKVLTISFLHSHMQIPINTSYNMGLLKQTWCYKSFLHAQGFSLCSTSKICVISHTHFF